MAKTCPVDGCLSKPGAGKFMCRPHWFATPKPLRDEVWRTWRIVEAGNGQQGYSPVQRLKEIRAYRDATAAAEQWWRDR